MSKNILLGAVDTLEWWQVKPWVMSAKESGFDGYIWLIVYRSSPDLIAKAEAEGVNIYQVNHTRHMTPIQHQVQNSPTVSHNLRFYHAWELLERLEVDKDYEYCIMTDVRDVVFQTNPIEWLEKHNYISGIIAPSEGMLFKDEPWNKDNMIRGYGETFYNLVVKDAVACNVGTIAGDIRYMKNMFHVLYSMTEGRYYPSDQSTFNVLVHTSWCNPFYLLEMDTGWAAQCGTTLDPTKSFLWSNVIGPRPTVANGKVYNSRGELYCLAHQWDRVPELKIAINEKYNK